MGEWRVCLLGGDVLTSPSEKVFPSDHIESLKLLKLLAVAGENGMLSETAARELYGETWENPLNGLRTQLARLNKRTKALDQTAIVQRVGDSLRFIPGFVTCDLWELRHVIEAARVGGPESERKAFAVMSNISPDGLKNSLDTALDPRTAEAITGELLRSLAILSVLPTASSHRLKILQIAAVVREYFHPNSVQIEMLLKLYASMHCKQEVLQTFLDYESYLSDELGEQPSARIRELCEGLLSQLEQTFANTSLEAPPRPEVTFGHEELLQSALTSLRRGGKIYIGGVAGVGKTHLAKNLATSPELAIYKIAWIDLSEHSPEDVENLVSKSTPDVLFLDGYSAKFSGVVRFVQALQKFHALVVIGSTPVGFDYLESFTVQPLHAGVEHHPGPATLFLENFVGGSVSNASRGAAIELAIASHGLPLTIQLMAGLAKTFGFATVVSQFTIANLQRATATQVLNAALLEAVSQFDSKVQRAIAALSGFGERVPISLVVEIFGLDLWVLKQLSDSGLISFNQDSLEVRVSQTVAEHLQAQVGFEVGNSAQIEFELALVTRCREHGVAPPKDEQLLSHLRAYQRVLWNLSERKDFEVAFELMAALRPHAGVLKDSKLNPLDYDEELWRTDHDSETFVKYALAVGSLYFLRAESDAFEEFLLRVFNDPRFQFAPLAAKIELHSQLGLALRRRGMLEESERQFDIALGMLDSSCHPSLQVKLLYNKSLTESSARKYKQSLETTRAAIKLAEFAPNDDARVELLNMEAAAKRRVGEPEAEVKSSIHVALALARMYKLRTQEGWILQNAVKLLPSLLGPSQSVVVGCVGMSKHMEEGLGHEIQRHLKGTCELLYGCLSGVGHHSLALESKLLKERLGRHPLYSGALDPYRYDQYASFDAPFSLLDVPLQSGEIISFIRACIRQFGKDPEVQSAVVEWGLDLSPWISTNEETEVIHFPASTAYISNA